MSNRYVVVMEQLEKQEMNSKPNLDKKIEIVENMKIISSLLPMMVFEQRNQLNADAKLNRLRDVSDVSNESDKSIKNDELSRKSRNSKDKSTTPNQHHESIQTSIQNVYKLLKEMTQQLNQLEKGNWNQDSSFKSILISTAQSILKESMSIKQSAKIIASKCADKILEKELQSIIMKMDTLSHQLRIVTAVKASNPLDVDSGNQMNQCASNLAHSLQMCFETCEIIQSLSLKSSNSL